MPQQFASSVPAILTNAIPPLGNFHNRDSPQWAAYGSTGGGGGGISGGVVQANAVQLFNNVSTVTMTTEFSGTNTILFNVNDARTPGTPAATNAMQLVPVSATPQEKDYRLVAPQILVLPNSESGDGSALAGEGSLGIRNNPFGGTFQQYSWVNNPIANPPYPAGSLEFLVNNSGSATAIDYILPTGETRHEQQQTFDGNATFNNPVAFNDPVSFLSSVSFAVSPTGIVSAPPSSFPNAVQFLSTVNFVSSVNFAVPPTGIPGGGGLAPVTAYKYDATQNVAPPTGAGQTIVPFGSSFTPTVSGVYMIEYYLGQNISGTDSTTWGAPDWIAGRLNYLAGSTPSFTGFSCIFPKSTPVSGSGGADNTDNSVTIVLLTAGETYTPAYVLNNGSGTSTWAAGNVSFECTVTSLCG
ncbi:hypothetical protein EBZ39_10995 [bacterium]|nr:hypothetical protein [bacterium]